MFAAMIESTVVSLYIEPAMFMHIMQFCYIIFLLNGAFCPPGAASLRSLGAVHVSQLASRASVVSLQRNPAVPLLPATAWQQTRHGSFFNKCELLKRLFPKSCVALLEKYNHNLSVKANYA